MYSAEGMGIVDLDFLDVLFTLDCLDMKSTKDKAFEEFMNLFEETGIKSKSDKPFICTINF